MFTAVAVLFLSLWFAVATAHAATFTASLDHDTISLGGSATLSLSFDGGSPGDIPGLPEIHGLQIASAGQSSQINIVNGQASSTFIYNFSVTPKQTGEFLIPALSANVNGQQVASKPVKLTVLAATAPPPAAINSGNEIAFMKLSLPKKEVYAGEIVTAQMDVYLRDDVQNFSRPQLASTPANGFTVGKVTSGSARRTQVGNRIYTVFPIFIALTATQSGDLSVGPFTLDATLLLPASDQQLRNPFFFSNVEEKPVTLTTEKLDVQSLPLPAENVPANFNGAVGTYTIACTAGPTNVAVGDPITIRAQISGRGALDSITLPDQSAWRGFKIFPPTSKVETAGQLGIEGTKTFEEIVAPQDTDVHELPSFSFSFFDPDQKTYRTLTQPAVPLSVHSAGSTPAPSIAANKPATQSPPPQQDILPIRENFGALAQAAAPLVTRRAFLALQSLPVLAFLAAFVWRKREESLANNPRLRRQRRVAQLVRDGVNDLHRLAAQNSSDEFFAVLFRLLQEQLGERLDCPASSITENVIDEHPVLRAAPKAALDGLRELFQLCNQTRYAPVRGTSELNSVAVQFEKVIGELQEVKA